MKTLSKYFYITALSAVISLSLTLTANAQHRNNGNGGGGNSSPAPAAAPAPAPRVSASPSAPSRPAPSQQNFSRPAPQQRSNYNAQQRFYNNNRNTGVVQRNNGVNTRSYAGHAGAGINSRVNGTVNSRGYRTYQGSVYGHNHPGYSGTRVGVRVGFLPGRAYYHYNRGYYGSYYAPRLGFSIGYLPYGYYPFYFGDYQYFYSEGLYYQYNNDQYTVVEPPVGAEVKTLPSNAQSIVINGQQYYEVNGVYYEPITKDDGTLSYQIAGKDGELNTDDQNGDNVDNAPPMPQIGDIVTELPQNCRKININGEKLYLSEDGIYYKAQLDQNNNKVYKIVGLPADDNQQQQQQSEQGGSN